MRLTLVNYAYDARSAEPGDLLDRYRSLTGWAEAVAAAGIEVSVAQRFHASARVTRAGIDYVFRRDSGNGDPGSRLWPRALHRAVRDLLPDVVHVNGLNVPLQTWLLRRSLPPSTAIIVQDHGGGPAKGPPTGGHYVRLAIRRQTLRAADAFFFSAAAQAAEWRRAGLIADNQPVHQVLEASTALRPVDRDEARRASGVDGDPAVLWVGRLNENKDPLTILDGFERAHARLPRARLTMIYLAGDLLPQVRQLLAASPVLAECVRLVGSVPHEQMPQFYSAADLFVLGSHHEGSGYALIEACACGLTPVVTGIPSFRVITADGAIGALWTVGAAADFADALVAAASRDRSAARRNVAEHFDRALSWPAVARQAADAYEGVLAAVRANVR
jgi:glycosyltransferase involved in cell wall biosynthesis